MYITSFNSVKIYIGVIKFFLSYENTEDLIA